MRISDWSSDVCSSDRPWTKAAPDTLGRNMAQFYWKARQEFSPGEWTLNLAVRHEGELVGCQDFQTNRFHVTLTGETGSWLAARHQGKGIGTAMRQAICALALDRKSTRLNSSH